MHWLALTPPRLKSNRVDALSFLYLSAISPETITKVPLSVRTAFSRLCTILHGCTTTPLVATDPERSRASSEGLQLAHAYQSPCPVDGSFITCRRRIAEVRLL